LTIAGFIAFLLIGLILGLIGGGGSILGVPVLVYVMSYPAEEATTYSLFIVGLTSLIGALSYLRKGEISAEALFQFAIASLISVFCTRKFIMPAISQEFSFFGLEISKNTLIMIVFSMLILASSMSMIRKRKPNTIRQVKWDEFNRSPLGLPFIILLGMCVGFITGWVFLVTISTIAIAGILLGSLLSGKISSTKLKPAFGWFTLVVGLFVFIKETLFS
jgi:uncharacterized protein